MNVAYPDSNGALVFDDKLYIQDTLSDDQHFDTLFRNHKIEKPKQNNKTKPPLVHLQKNAHYPSEEISVPTCIRNDFRDISSLPPQKNQFSLLFIVCTILP